MAEKRELEEKRQKHFREALDRLTAVDHTAAEHFREHAKIEGYYEHPQSEGFFGKDRLLKRENMFGVVQLGYDPDKDCLFLFAHMKTSRYDTAASRYQKEMKEQSQTALTGKPDGSRAFVSRRQEMAAVLIEKRQGKSWARTIQAYKNRRNMETVEKLLPFFSREEEREELARLKEERRRRQGQIRRLLVEKAEAEEEKEAQAERRARESEAVRLRSDAVHGLISEQLLETVLAAKSAQRRRFLGQLNHAYACQKTELKEYYRERRKSGASTTERAQMADGAAEDEKE